MPPLVSVISCALNQGDWVRKTVPEIRRSLGDWPHEVLIVDDQSTDGCCSGLDRDVLVLRTETRMGVSASRRLAVRQAKGDLLLFTDPHCQYPDNALWDLAAVASVKQAICLPKTTGKPTVRRTRHGGYLGESDRGLKVNYALRGPADWPALLGTIYAMQRSVYDHLGGWPELPGVWGCSEQALSLMAWFAGVPIYVDTRHLCNHQDYHPKDKAGGQHFTYRVPMSHHANNAHWVHAGFFPLTYESHWKPMLRNKFREKPENLSCLEPKGWPSKEAGIGYRTLSGFHEEIRRRAVRSEEEFFRWVLGKPMPPGALDEQLVNQQRKRSKPGRNYSGVDRRQKRALDWFLREVPGCCIKGMHILDMGCRNGALVEMMKQKGAHAEGVELVPETAHHARTVLKRNVRAGDIRRLNDRDNTWDRVTCLHAMEHVPDPENVMKELVRVLRPGGWFCIAVPKEAEPDKRAAHNCAFKDAQALLDLVKRFPVDHVKAEVKGLKPKREEILLLGKKRDG